MTMVELSTLLIVPALLESGIYRHADHSISQKVSSGSIRYSDLSRARVLGHAGDNPRANHDDNNAHQPVLRDVRKVPSGRPAPMMTDDITMDIQTERHEIDLVNR